MIYQHHTIQRIDCLVATIYVADAPKVVRTWQVTTTGLDVIRLVLLTRSILYLAELGSDDLYVACVLGRLDPERG